MNDPLPDPHLKTGGENLVSKHTVEAEAVEKVSDNALNETKLLKIRRKYRYIVYKIERNYCRSHWSQNCRC